MLIVVVIYNTALPDSGVDTLSARKQGRRHQGQRHPITYLVQRLQIARRELALEAAIAKPEFAVGRQIWADRGGSSS